MPKRQKPAGRPAVDSEAITLRLPRELLNALDDFRRVQPDLPTRPEAVRRILLNHFKPLGD